MSQVPSSQKSRWLLPGVLGVLVIVMVIVAGFQYAQASSMQSQISDLKSQVSSLQSQTSSLQSQVSGLQSQNSNLQSQVSSLQSMVSSQNALLSLSVSTSEANQVSINQAAGDTSTITTFTGNYAGYVHITGTSTTTNGFIRVTDSFYAGGNPTNYQFGTGATLDLGVLPGTITVSFGNTNFSNGASATITVVYYS